MRVPGKRRLMQASGEHVLLQAEHLLHTRNVQQAQLKFNAAEAAGADTNRCSAGRWTAHMLRGNFEEAWLQSDAIRGNGAPDPHRFWVGDPIDGQRVMLRCLHGFGDSVQMLRYAPILRARASKLIVEVAPEFVELAGRFQGIDEVITWGQKAPVSPPQWDVQMEVVELPYVFRTELADLPIATNYLRLAEAKDPEVGLGPHTKLRVGLVWASGEWNPSRSVPIVYLRPLLQTPGCEFWNLQGGTAVQQLDLLGSGANIRTDVPSANNLLRLAEIIARLDLVITPDTLAAHLAGAIGTPAWVMLQHASDWRWMLEREDSPWYPSMRLFRQPSDGDWKSVLDSIEASLALVLQHRKSQRVVLVR